MISSSSTLTNQETERTDQIGTEIENPVTDMIESSLADEIDNQLTDLIENPVTDQIDNPLTDAIENPVTEAIDNPLTDQTDQVEEMEKSHQAFAQDPAKVKLEIESQAK